jgi:hypothetical protein
MCTRFGKTVKRPPANSALLDLMMDVATVFSVLNIAVLAGLLVVYGRIAFRSGASYTFGLVIFAALLLLQNSVTAYSYVEMTPFFGETVLPYLMTISVLEFGGLLALTKVTI